MRKGAGQSAFCVPQPQRARDVCGRYPIFSLSFSPSAMRRPNPERAITLPPALASLMTRRRSIPLRIARQRRVSASRRSCETLRNIPSSQFISSEIVTEMSVGILIEISRTSPEHNSIGYVQVTREVLRTSNDFEMHKFTQLSNSIVNVYVKRSYDNCNLERFAICFRELIAIFASRKVRERKLARRK